MEIIYNIKKALKKKSEEIILDLYLKDYDKSNFYFALVFNKKIEKFKVLYVPIDGISKNDKIEEYFCYQFIFLHTVNYMLETIALNESKFGNKNLDRANSKMTSYYIEINTYVDSKNYKYTFTQFIDKEFLFFFDILVTLFEHLPNVVSELCTKLLGKFNDDYELIEYTSSYEFNFNDDLERLFSRSVIEDCKYTFDDIDFLEQIGNRYYAVVKGYLVIIEYSEYNNLFNVSSLDFDNLGEEIYIITRAIKEEYQREFYRLMIANSEEDFENNQGDYYLCYGIDDEKFKVANGKENIDVTLDLIKNKCVKILNSDSELEEQLRNYLSEIYEDRKVKELLDFMIIREP